MVKPALTSMSASSWHFYFAIKYRALKAAHDISGFQKNINQPFLAYCHKTRRCDRNDNRARGGGREKNRWREVAPPGDRQVGEMAGLNEAAWRALSSSSSVFVEGALANACMLRARSSGCGGAK